MQVFLFIYVSIQTRNMTDIDLEETKSVSLKKFLPICSQAAKHFQTISLVSVFFFPLFQLVGKTMHLTKGNNDLYPLGPEFKWFIMNI